MHKGLHLYTSNTTIITVMPQNLLNANQRWYTCIATYPCRFDEHTIHSVWHK